MALLRLYYGFIKALLKLYSVVCSVAVFQGDEAVGCAAEQRQWHRLLLCFGRCKEYP